MPPRDFRRRLVRESSRCSARGPAPRPTSGCSWTRSSTTWARPDCPGATCPSGSATGTASGVASTAPAARGVWAAAVRGASRPGCRVAAARLDGGIRAHPCAAGAKQQRAAPAARSGQELGRVAGEGSGPEVHAAVSGLGLPVRPALSGGQEAGRDECGGTARGAVARGGRVRQASDCGRARRVRIDSAGVEAVIPGRANRTDPRDIDRDVVPRAEAGGAVPGEGEAVPPGGDALREVGPGLPGLRASRVRRDPAAIDSLSTRPSVLLITLVFSGNGGAKKQSRGSPPLRFGKGAGGWGLPASARDGCDNLPRSRAWAALTAGGPAPWTRASRPQDPP